MCFLGLDGDLWPLEPKVVGLVLRKRLVESNLQEKGHLVFFWQGLQMNDKEQNERFAVYFS
jgi:hypothetical protein